MSTACFLCLRRRAARSRLLVEDAGAHEGVRDGVGIAVAARPAVLEVSLLVLGDAARNANTGGAVGDAAAEVVDAAGLALAGKSALVVLALEGIVRLDVLLVALAHALDRPLDLGDTAVRARRLRRVVRVGASAVPAALHGLRVQGDHHAELLGHAVQDEAGDPEVVAGVDAHGWADLERGANVSASLIQAVMMLSGYFASDVVLINLFFYERVTLTRVMHLCKCWLIRGDKN